MRKLALLVPLALLLTGCHAHVDHHTVHHHTTVHHHVTVHHSTTRRH